MQINGAWKPVLTALAKAGIVEATFHVNGEAVTVKEMNESRTAMVDAIIGAETSFDGEQTFRVSVKALIRALKHFDKPTLTIEGNRIVITEGSRTKTIPRVEENTDEEPPTPKFEPSIEAEADFSKVRTMAETFALEKVEAVTLEVKDGKLVASIQNSVGEYAEDELATVEGKGKATYSLALLKPLEEKWTVKFGENTPLHAERVFENGKEQPTATVRLYVAPRIEVD